MTIRQVAVVVGMTAILTACGGRHDDAPPCPTCPAGSGSNATYSLFGVITGMTPAGPVPLSGAHVTESTSRSRITANADGSYRFVRIPAATSTVSVSRGGYTTRATTAAITGDTRLDMQLDPWPTYTLSGVISEPTATGLVPIEGVLVEEMSYDEVTGDYVSWSATTDHNGLYSLSGLWGQPGVLNAIWLTKAGYNIDMNPTCDWCYRPLTVTGDMRLDIQLERTRTAAVVSSSTSLRRPR